MTRCYWFYGTQAGTAQGQPSDHGTQPPNKRPKMTLPSTATSAVPVVDYQVRACRAARTKSIGSERAVHTHPFNGPFPGLPRWAGTRKVKPIWILLKQETVSGSGISWAICKSTLLQTDNHASTPLLRFYRPDALPATQPTASKHWESSSCLKYNFSHQTFVRRTWIYRSLQFSYSTCSGRESS